jgi:hypothetical protein
VAQVVARGVVLVGLASEDAVEVLVDDRAPVVEQLDAAAHQKAPVPGEEVVVAEGRAEARAEAGGAVRVGVVDAGEAAEHVEGKLPLALLHGDGAFCFFGGKRRARVAHGEGEREGREQQEGGEYLLHGQSFISPKR